MRFFWLAIATLGLASPAMAQGNSDKNVTVTMANGKFATSPEPVPVMKSQNRIVWTIGTAGYTFAANGIVIKGGGNEYGECGMKSASRTEFSCKKLKHVDLKRYKYDVNLVDASGKVLNFDPIIINE